MKNYKKASAMLLIAAVSIAYGTSFTIAGQKSDINSEVPGQYIVVFNDDVNDVDQQTDAMVGSNGLVHLKTYKNAIKGFAASIPSHALEKIKNNPKVKFVSEDRAVSAYGSFENNKPGSGKGKPSPSPQPSQVLPTGVDRIDAENLINKGAGVTVAVIDTGIEESHPDLKGQVIGGVNCSTGRRNSYKDGNGHGTHVAGTIAALENEIGAVGVAPNAKLLAVRVLDNAGNGTWSSVICGIDWVTANADRYGIKVANMSLGGSGISDNNCGNTNGDALHQAICGSRNAGVTYVVAAGNEADNAANHVPAAYDDAVITVSALADSDGLSGGIGPNLDGWNYPDDTFADFSNYGAVVDVGAPGVNIFSTWKGGTYNVISGTSMATPHVSGLAVLYVSSNPASDWIGVKNALVASGETLGSGLHTDPSGNHPEPVAKANGL